jgi:hypothetical protein
LVTPFQLKLAICSKQIVESVILSRSGLIVKLKVAKESHPVKTVANECGLFEIHGNEPSGFEIRHGNNAMRSRFKSIDEAVMALEMFAARRAQQDESADYIEEA